MGIHIPNLKIKTKQITTRKFINLELPGVETDLCSAFSLGINFTLIACPLA